MMVVTRSLALGVVMLAGCAVGAWAQAPSSQPTPGTPTPAVGAPAASGAAASTYERKGRRDPFEPIDVVDASMTAPTVASARLKGIVRGRTPRVLVETPDGLGYILKVGDVLGEGRLVEIGPDSAVFSVPGRPGSTTTRIVLRLPDD